jgi:hypothetical protein
LADLLPNAKPDEIQVMAAITTQQEITAYLKQLGQEVKK